MSEAIDSAKPEEVVVQNEIEEAIRASGEKVEAVSGKIDVKTEGGNVTIPSFFVSEDDREKIEVDVLFDKTNGRIVTVTTSGLITDEDRKKFDYLGYSQEWFEFTVPDYEQMASYRNRASIFRPEVNRMVVDTIQIRNFYLVWHLKDWSIRDKNGNKLNLTHDENGSLSKKSIRSVYSLSSTILDVVLTSFEKDVIVV